MSLTKRIVFSLRGNNRHTICPAIEPAGAGHRSAIAAAGGVTNQSATRWSLEDACGSC
jgi:hypothetical protein